jgi:hypothetical protein
VNITKLLFLTALATAFATAGPISFTESIVTSGSLNGTSFTNQLLTLTLSGDTSSITSPLSGIFKLNAPASVTVLTVGSDTFTDSIIAVDNQNFNEAGFGDFTTNAAILFTTNVAFGSYALNTSIGPLSGTSAGSISPSAFATTGGTLVLNGPFNVDHPATFTASASIPEPGTLGILGMGIGLLALKNRKSRVSLN